MPEDYLDLACQDAGADPSGNRERRLQIAARNLWIALPGRDAAARLKGACFQEWIRHRVRETGRLFQTGRSLIPASSPP
jgi:hypothetical protein